MAYFTGKHKRFLEKLNVTLDEIMQYSYEEEERFIMDRLVPYISGCGTKEEEDLADDMIDIIQKGIRREKNRSAAREILEDIRRGYYVRNGKKIRIDDRDEIFPYRGASYTDVEVLSPERLESIENDDDEFFECSFYGSTSCSFYLMNADSFEAAEQFPDALVMNFANAHKPGGGFLSGSFAQEESLCHCSTLYASISSPEAREMYDYNNRHYSPVDSHYMLLSENVCVFRKRSGEYREEPFHTSVLTVAAPDVRHRAADVPKDELDYTIYRRLRYFLYACARYNYRNLVLGAWGCGAFGNDPEEVARCFYRLFFEEGFHEFFYNVAFAVMGGGANYRAFEKVFDGKLEKAPDSPEGEDHPV